MCKSLYVCVFWHMAVAVERVQYLCRHFQNANVNFHVVEMLLYVQCRIEHANQFIATQSTSFLAGKNVI